MTPEQARYQRDMAIRNFTLWLERASSYDVDLNSTNLQARVMELKQRLTTIEGQEAAAQRARYEQSQEWKEQQIAQYGGYAPGGTAIPRGEGGKRPLPTDPDAAVEQVVQEMQARGLGRI